VITRPFPGATPISWSANGSAQHSFRLGDAIAFRQAIADLACQVSASGFLRNIQGARHVEKDTPLRHFCLCNGLSGADLLVDTNRDCPASGKLPFATNGHRW